MTEYVRACALSDLTDSEALGVEVKGEPVAVVRTGSEVFAIRDVCSHAEVPLSDGEVNGRTVDIPSYLVVPGEELKIRGAARGFREVPDRGRSWHRFRKKP